MLPVIVAIPSAWWHDANPHLGYSLALISYNVFRSGGGGVTIQTSYMGTKRKLAPRVASVVSSLRPGPLLDLFSGVCAVGAAVTPTRQVWSNDVQYFSANVGAAFFTSRRAPLNIQSAADLLFPLYNNNKAALTNRWDSELAREGEVLNANDFQSLLEFEDALPYIATDKKIEDERKCLALDAHQFPYRLFAITFPGSYFSLAQCVQIDSIRFAIEGLYVEERICLDERRWMCLALCEAVRKVSTTTGHFAQYLRPNDRNKRRFFAQRRRSVWKEWLLALDNLAPLGSLQWRTSNRSFRTEALELLATLEGEKERPAIIYADPPYTGDQYSRYYHVYETLLLYDYPIAVGQGRYRDGRFVSDFCLASRVRGAFESLASACARLGSTLVLSYPDGGLLENPREELPNLLLKFFRRCDSSNTYDHFHSSFGASNGHDKSQVLELLFVAS